MEEVSDRDVFESGERPSIVEGFTISGLHGYRSVSLASPYAASILIAKNGSGKTTMLGALDAFLKCQFTRLRDLQFSEIKCKLRGVKKELILKKDDLSGIFEVSPDGEIARFAKRFDVDSAILTRFLLEEYEQIKNDAYNYTDDKLVSAIQNFTGFLSREFTSFCERLRSILYASSSNLLYVTQTIRTALEGIEVIYLPTYRRIELSLLNDDRYGNRRRRPKLRFSSAASLYTGDIQFGLSDIQARLADINQSILSKSNLGYRQISASIINELIDGTFERGNFTNTHIPDRETLQLFFSRLKEGGRSRPYSDVTIPNIEKIYNDDDFGLQTKKTLTYFLGKLSAVIDTTKEIEAPVEEFVMNCNKYLSSEDESAQPPVRGRRRFGKRHAQLDEKVLRLDRRTLKVDAYSAGRKIPLDALSSGEKQMISLFAKLYLYPNNKIILIDEPELSLSIEWQRHILQDILIAPFCSQVIAITHSPFVFDNVLEPFAKSIKLSVDEKALKAIAEDDEVGFGE